MMLLLLYIIQLRHSIMTLNIDRHPCITHIKDSKNRIVTIAYTKATDYHSIAYAASIWKRDAVYESWNRKQQNATAVNRFNISPIVIKAFDINHNFIQFKKDLRKFVSIFGTRGRDRVKGQRTIDEINYVVYRSIDDFIRSSVFPFDEWRKSGAPNTLEKWSDYFRRSIMCEYDDIIPDDTLTKYIDILLQKYKHITF
jgi:hypothetical protein